MAFDFLGTFNKSQFDRFIEFARKQLVDVGGRIAHLTYEKSRIGSLAFEYDAGGVPTKYTVSSATTTYIGGLVAAYEALGGDVIHDLQVRTRNQSIFLEAGSDTTSPSRMSSGDYVAAKGLGDAVSAEWVRQARSWMASPIHYRREYLERKIRRAIDYVEQLDDELAVLTVIGESKDTRDSLEFVATAVQSLLSDLNYRPIFDDKGADPHGKTSNAPLLPYSKTGADPETVSPDPEMAGRDDDGFRYSGQV